MQKRIHVIVALVVLLMGLLLWLVLIPISIEDSPFGRIEERVTATFFPTVVAVTLVAAAAALLLTALTGREQTSVSTTFPVRVRLGIGLALLYHLLFYYLGFVVSSSLALFGFFWLFGERRRKVLFVASPLVAIGFRLVFGAIFGIRLHPGLLF